MAATPAGVAATGEEPVPELYGRRSAGVDEAVFGMSL